MSRERGQTCWHYRGVSENLVVFELQLPYSSTAAQQHSKAVYRMYTYVHHTYGGGPWTAAKKAEAQVQEY